MWVLWIEEMIYKVIYTEMHGKPTVQMSTV